MATEDRHHQAIVTPPTAEPGAPIDKYRATQWLGDHAVRRFRAMVEPAGWACDLDCAHCFYLSKQTLPGGPGGGRMSDETLERYVADCIRSVTGDEVVFSWQGGEPTLRGLDFLRKVVALQKKFKKAWQRIENDLQTNGTPIDADWARFLRESRRPRRRPGTRRACPSSAARRRGPTIRGRWSRRGRATPTSTTASCASSGTNGWRATAARCS